MMNITKLESDNFWKKIRKSKDGCWNWERAVNRKGYGVAWFRGKVIPSHRLAWIIKNGEIEESHSIFRKCKNDLCCNPSHLFCDKHHAEHFRKDRFFSRVSKEKSGCWQWIGTTNKYGYGIICVDYKFKRAHRYSWEIHNGEIPKGLCVCHHCDNPKCVNPKHLFIGTKKDNTNDMMSKKRNNPPLGERCARAVLDIHKVRKIRNLLSEKVPQIEISRMFKVSVGAIACIHHKRTWRHLN